MRDIQYAVRTLARAPVFTLTVVLTLALGIGANTAIFSIVDRLMLRALPYPAGEQLVVIHETGLTTPRMDVSPANWLDWQRDNRSFEALAIWTNRAPSTLTGQGEPERLKSDTVSHEFFSILRVQPLLGRIFSAEDDGPGAPRTVVLSYPLWQRKFGSDPNIIGKTIELNATATEVIGVMPPGFYFLSHDTDLWNIFALDRNQPWRETAGRFIPYVVGRLKPAVTYDSAKADLETIAGRLSQLYAVNKNTSAKIIPLREAMTGEVRASLLFLFAAVGVLLLIACSNVANLLLARSAYRRREVAIRISLGAGRGAILRLLVIESLLLATAGGMVGILIARWGIRLFLTLVPANLMTVPDVPIDPRIWLYTLGLSVFTGVVAGVAPALLALRRDAADALRSGGRSVTQSMTVRRVLIVVQVAMTTVLLCGAGLLVRSLLALIHDETGVRAENVLSMRIELPASRYNPSQRVDFFRRVTERLESLSGVQSASASNDIPIGTPGVLRLSRTGFQIAGQPELAPNERPSTFVRVIAPGYFKTLGIPLMKGRDFTQDDQRDGAALAFVVNQAFAKRYFPAGDALSSSISVAMQRENPYGSIIGIVGDVKERSLRGSAEPTVFYNHRQLPGTGMTLFIRTSRGAEVIRQATQIVREFDRNLPVIEVRMLEDAFAQGAARERLNAIVSAAFAVCALVLASLGLYGLLAFTVAERTNEIGIRMALGAQASQVLRMVMIQGLRLVAVGAVLGLAAAFAVSRFLSSLLFGITSHDPATFAGVAGLLLAVSAAAVLIPARRATQINPVVALRKD
jgi:putative ABC transport system permease protein